jgi:hypothetical protein
MPIATTSVIKLSNFPPTLPHIPLNYPSGPAPGKLELILNANSTYLYHEFSPYTNYKDSVLASVLSDRQPFLYTYIDQYQNGLFNKLPQSVQSLGSIVGITPDTVNDVVRVSNFIISTWGVQFLVTQAAIQRLAPFDETRIYNPLSPVLATVYPLTLGLGDMPIRHIEGGLLGLANSVTSIVGINLESGFQTPASTVGSAALPTINTGQGKGLIRGSDAAKGAASFQSKWQPAKSTNGSILSSALNNFASSVQSSFKAFFGSAPKAKGIFRSDEEGYKIMSLGFANLYQPWFASATDQVDKINTYGMPPTPNKTTFGIVGSPLGTGNAQTVFIKQKLISLPDRFVYVPTTDGIAGYVIGTKTTGYGAGDKYTDVIGRQPQSNVDGLTNSDVTLQYSYYIQESNNYPTKLSDPQSSGVAEIEKQLQSVINDINAAPTYKVFTNNWSYLLPYGSDARYVGYDNWTSRKAAADFGKAIIGKIGTGEEYNAAASGPTNNDTTIPKTIDVYGSKTNNLRMATTFMSDGINMLTVLDSSRNTPDNDLFNAVYPNWVEWKPYNDDLIAFFFYDVVNDKYIPFRATVKGISEGNTAFWDELRFIGRADQLYSYNGFSRTLSFTFNVVINSVSELLPSWEKINYIASAVKPSNYTSGQVINQAFNRFIVPPMFMITIGDLYKFQPMVITSINVNIPDDASWETLNENNSILGWSYLNGLVTSPNLGKNYGQLPREVEVAVTCNLLEKERAIVGGSHFGHGPRVDNWENLNVDSRFSTGSANIPYLPVPTTLHKNFVVWNNPGSSLKA